MLWKALAVTTGDLIVYVDADLLDFRPTFVTGPLGPLLTDPTVGLVKAFYDRPLLDSSVLRGPPVGAGVAAIRGRLRRGDRAADRRG